MSIVMEEEIKRWTALRNSALVLEIIKGKTTIAEASRPSCNNCHALGCHSIGRQLEYALT
jgi:positive regulator of sigma E activity